MEYIAQFIVTFALGALATYSLRRWTMIAAMIFGILAIPLLAVLFFAGDGATFWQSVGDGIAVLLTGLLNLTQAGFAAMPVMTAGTLIGAIWGTGLLR